jgi:hypothetical protein
MTLKSSNIQRVAELVSQDRRATVYFWQWLTALWLQVNPGPTLFSGTITTAKLTGGGANGSMTFVNGILTSQTPAT